MKKMLQMLALAMLLLSPQQGWTQTTSTELTNLIVFVRFAGESEIVRSYDNIDIMYNDQSPTYLSVYNFFDALTYGRIHFNTITTNNIHDGYIVSYQDIHPRNYYQPRSHTNTIGYNEGDTIGGFPVREVELLERVVRYVDSLGLVDPDVVLDGDGDGDIDNITFVLNGVTGDWGTILWPHMGNFPQELLDHPATINGLPLNTINVLMTERRFSPNTICHEMGHSLDLPDLYHYYNYTLVSPAGSWDIMCNSTDGVNHTAAIMKNKYLHVCDDPIRITADGDYTLNSVGSSPTRNCYYIKSFIDSTQWYVLEYRYKHDRFEYGTPATGLLVARWVDTVSLDWYDRSPNGYFDFHHQAHQYWIFRPGSDVDTVDGSIGSAFFSQASGRTTFGPDTDPHPYLTDGTPEMSFEITDIRENGPELTFHVHFLVDGIDDVQPDAPQLTVWPNPTTDILRLSCSQPVVASQLFNSLGQQVMHAGSSIMLDLSSLPAGVYLLRVALADGGMLSQRVVKVQSAQ